MISLANGLALRALCPARDETAPSGGLAAARAGNSPPCRATSAIPIAEGRKRGLALSEAFKSRRLDCRASSSGVTNAPSMRATRQPAQHIFGADDREAEGTQGAVEVDRANRPPGFKHAAQAPMKAGHRRHARPPPWRGPIEASPFATRPRRSRPDSRSRALTLAMGIRDLDVLARRIDAGDCGAQAGKGSAEKPPPQPISSTLWPAKMRGSPRIPAEMRRRFAP